MTCPGHTDRAGTSAQTPARAAPGLCPALFCPRPSPGFAEASASHSVPFQPLFPDLPTHDPSTFPISPLLPDSTFLTVNTTLCDPCPSVHAHDKATSWDQSSSSLPALLTFGAAYVAHCPQFPLKSILLNPLTPSAQDSTINSTEKTAILQLSVTKCINLLIPAHPYSLLRIKGVTF